MLLEPKVGGKCCFNWKDWGPDRYTNNSDGKVVAFEPHTLLAFEWYAAGRENPTTIRFNLEPTSGGTALTIEESGYLDTDEARAGILSCASGWGEAATLLEFLIEHGIIYTQPAPIDQG